MAPANNNTMTGIKPLQRDLPLAWVGCTGPPPGVGVLGAPSLGDFAGT